MNLGEQMAVEGSTASELACKTLLRAIRLGPTTIEHWIAVPS